MEPSFLPPPPHFVSSSRQFLIKRVVAVKLGTIYSFYRCKYARGSQAKLTVAACSPPPSRITSSCSNRTKCGSGYTFFSLRIGKRTFCSFLIHNSKYLFIRYSFYVEAMIVKSRFFFKSIKTLERCSNTCILVYKSSDVNFINSLKKKIKNLKLEDAHISYIMIIDHFSITIVASSYLFFCLIFLCFDC